MIDIKALGGIKEYGRNCFIITHQRTKTRIMLDCGVRNGHLEIYPEITKEIAVSIQAVFISHVHNDHIGALPLLIEQGFQGDIWMSEASFHQLPAILAKWPALPLKNIQFRSFSPSSRGEAIPFTEGFSLTWGYSGHMLGSAWYAFQFPDTSLFFSGDFVCASPLLKTDMPLRTSYDIALIDSGHAGQVMPYGKSIENILAAVRHTEKKYLFPVTLSGKTCDLLFYLFQNLPYRHFFVHTEVYHHLQMYLNHLDNLQKEQIFQLQEMLQSNNITCFTSGQRLTENGIYFSNKALQDDGFHLVKTNQYSGADSCFYKSHPDYQDIQSFLQRLYAKKYIFFHSKPADLDWLLQKLYKKEKHLGGL